MESPKLLEEEVERSHSNVGGPHFTAADNSNEAGSYKENSSKRMSPASRSTKSSRGSPRLPRSQKSPSSKSSNPNSPSSRGSNEDEDDNSQYDGDDDDDQYLYGYLVQTVLIVVGLTTGLVNGCVLWVTITMSKYQSDLIRIKDGGPFIFVVTTTLLCGLSAFITKLGGLSAAYGSGMPEVKALLVSDFHPSEYPIIVSLRIFLLRVLGLIPALGSGLAIGIAGPLVHASVSTAYCIIRFIPQFTELLDNPTVMKQIFAASAAVGLTTVFNAPVGGLLFSVEVTSTYYLISNYWRSFMVASIGGVMYSIVLLARGDSYRLYEVDYIANPYKAWEFPLFFLLGALCGVFSYLYLKFHQMWFLLVRSYVTNHPVLTSAIAGALSAALIYAVGAYNQEGLSGGVLVENLFKDGDVSEMQSYAGVSRLGGLIAALLVRIVLTVVATNLRISAGLFLPMLTLGALVGRIFGQIVQDIVGSQVNIYVGGYAMVGAVGFVSGTTHTLSAAVIVIELTGQLGMMLPCLIAAVLASGFAKVRSLSLYDQGMVNKGLESFDLLVQASGGYHCAADLLDDSVYYVPRKCTIADLFHMLEESKGAVFPLIDSLESDVLFGCIDRRDVFAFLKRVFEKADLVPEFRIMLPEDCRHDDVRVARRRRLLIQQQQQQQQQFGHDNDNNHAGSFGLHGMEYPGHPTGGTASSLWRRSFSTDSSNSRAGGGSGSGGGMGILGGLSHFSLGPAGIAQSKGRSGLHRHFASFSFKAADSAPGIGGGGGGGGGGSTGSLGGEGSSDLLDDDELLHITVTHDGNTTGALSAGAGHPPTKGMSTALRMDSLSNPTAASHSRNNNLHLSRPLLNALIAIHAPAAAATNPTAQQMAAAVSAVSAESATATNPTGGVSSSASSSGEGGKTAAVPAGISSGNSLVEWTIGGNSNGGEREERVAAVLKLAVEVPDESLLRVNSFPFTAHESASIEQLYVLFEMVKVDCVFVVDAEKKLKGIISKSDLLQNIRKKVR